MTYDCDLIQDLLPLYQEDLCSGASRQAVEAHLGCCERCRALLSPLPIEPPEELPAADRAVKRSIRKVRRRWLASLMAALLAVPVLLLSVNQYSGRGLCFTNPDEVFTAWRFLHALETGDWEKAAGLHGYSYDYESIIEALNQDVTFWGTTFTPCDLAGYAYMAKPYLVRHDLLPQRLGDLYGFLYNRTGTAMVPLELWERLMALDPDAFSQNGWEYWLNGERYGKITTPWGEFVTSEGRGYDTAYEYATYFDLIPAAIYEEAKPALEAEALRLDTTTHDHIGWVADLTETEFIEEMTRRYTADLGTLEGSVTFDCTGYRSVHRMEDSWYVSFAVTITQEGKSLDTEIDLRVRDGKIEIAGISHQPGVSWLDAIDRALYPSAHPEY